MLLVYLGLRLKTFQSSSSSNNIPSFETSFKIASQTPNHALNFVELSWCSFQTINMLVYYYITWQFFEPQQRCRSEVNLELFRSDLWVVALIAEICALFPTQFPACM